jgi:hypothetical protein
LGQKSRLVRERSPNVFGSRLTFSVGKISAAHAHKRKVPVKRARARAGGRSCRYEGSERPASPHRAHTVSDRKLRSGGRAHELTTADRRKGAERTNEIKRARRDEAEQEARHMLADAVSEAVATLRAGLKAEEANTRIRSAVAILDRAWGRPRQAVEAAVTVAPTVTQAEVDAGRVLADLSELGLISLPKKNGEGD